MKNKYHTLSISILCLALLMAACGQEPVPEAAPSPLPAPTEPAQESGDQWHLVVIGDSSLWRLGKAFAAQIEKDLGVEVVLADYALPELSAGQVLADLQRETPPYGRMRPEFAEDLRQAEVVVMFVNPRDSVDPGKPLDLEGCFTSRLPAACSPEAFEQYTADMKALWAEILALRGGEPAVLRATDLYNPLVSPWRDAGVFEACTGCWQNMSDAVRLAAEAYNIPFLSRLDAFNGPDHDEDPREKGFIHGDGEHPSELGAQFTAELLSQMGYEPVSPPEGATGVQGMAATPQGTLGPTTVQPDTPAPAAFYLSEPGP